MILAFYDYVRRITIESDVQINTCFYKKNELVNIETYERDGRIINVYISPTFEPHEEYTLSVNGTSVFVEMRGIVKKTWFKETYRYDGKLGNWVENNTTHFAVYAPTTSKVSVLMNEQRYLMFRDATGVHHLELEGSFHGQAYLYEVVRYNKVKLTTDPYAKASVANREASVVVDESQIVKAKRDFVEHKNPIIAEMSVRDFSMDPEVPFSQRGKFLGMLESHGNYGFAHILDLGVTHVQLMPINDFATVNELNPTESYNWGYDPMQYLALEGSYSSNVHNPLQGINDLVQVVNAYHGKNIGVNVDVVFNHVYEVENHPFHILAPYYYFRYTRDYYLSNGSFCGNEVASEMPMARKHIIDACVHFVDWFAVDGYRFDLMGLLDIETMNELSAAVRELNPNAMIYGEGWRMPTVYKPSECATIDNAHKMKTIGFFNDTYRDSIGGRVNGETSSILMLHDQDGSICSLMNGNNNYPVPPEQSINYVECHDNYTLADRIAMHRLSPHDAQRITRVVIASKGIPFIQIGQTFFRNKKGDGNSYQSSDEVNRINWSMLDAYKDMNDDLSKWIHWRRDVDQSYGVCYHYGNIEIK